jgi:predicted dehydrogenase/threonine dehydrogenase-like Zn-dependent dehydrogenase
LKQILQNAKSGELELAEVPAPTAAAGQVLVRSQFSVVSPGTDKLAMSFAHKSLLGKARSRPDLVRQVVRKLRQDGPLSTYRTVMTRLEAPQPLGYSSAGVVVEVGEGVARFAPGDRVACAGAGYASHAELVVVPENLVARVPDSVSLQQAAFATLGAIALQGLRVAQPTLGEIAAVVGLGLIGQLAVQLLRASGCRVLGIDLDGARVTSALDQGAEWGATPGGLPQNWRDEATGGYGVDMALVTAAADTSAPIQLAAELCRFRGRISIVGAMPMELDRRTFYEKELELRMSTSYGPGRYDRTYEEIGLDYPLPYVRWTENRNLQAFLALVASRAVTPQQLDTEVVPFDQAVRVYEDLAKGQRRSLAVLFQYTSNAPRLRTLPIPPNRGRVARASLGVAFLGAGNYAKGVLLPVLPGPKQVRRVHLVTATGASARHSAERFGFAVCGTDPEAVFADQDVDLVFIATRHDSHARLAARALRAGKAVWLEKPAALFEEELAELENAVRETRGFLAVGYNRRFSRHTRAVKEAFAGRVGPLALHYSVAAGAPPTGTWITDPREGGGRIVGEVCHFVDLCTYLVGMPPKRIFARAFGHDPEIDDSMTAILGFDDGSTACLEYLARASTQLPKERFEVSADGRTARSENYRITRFVGGSFKDVKTINQDKGQAAAVAEVVAAAQEGRPSPFLLEELVAVSRASFALLTSAGTGQEITLQ